VKSHIASSDYDGVVQVGVGDAFVSRRAGAAAAAREEQWQPPTPACARTGHMPPPPHPTPSHPPNPLLPPALQLWDAASATDLMCYEEHAKRVWSLDFCAADPARLVSGSDDGTVRLWSVHQEGSVAAIDTHANVCSVQFAPDSAHLLAVGSANYRWAAAARACAGGERTRCGPHASCCPRCRAAAAHAAAMRPAAQWRHLSPLPPLPPPPPPFSRPLPSPAFPP
jgi:hypothetical protein